MCSPSSCRECSENVFLPCLFLVLYKFVFVDQGATGNHVVVRSTTNEYNGGLESFRGNLKKMINDERREH